MFDASKLGEIFNSVQEKSKEMLEQNRDSRFSAKSGGGLVEVVLNGNYEVLDISIDDSLLEDKESLQILLISALNDANKSVEESKKSMALDMLGGLNLK